jgi:hypothetical protein
MSNDGTQQWMAGAISNVLIYHIPFAFSGVLVCVAITKYLTLGGV